MFSRSEYEHLEWGHPFSSEPVPHRHWSHGEFHLWPFWARLCILPVLLPLAPFAFIAMLVQDLGGFRNIKPWAYLYLPVVMAVFPVVFLLPRMLPFITPLLRPLSRELAIRGLLQDAFSRRKMWY